MGKLPARHAVLGILMSMVLGATIIALILMVVQNQTVDRPLGPKYGIVIDAGSTHTALFLYRWPAGKENNTAIVSQVGLCDVDGPGISSYGLDPPRAGQSLVKCLRDLKQAIPAGQWGATPVYLGATAGMRLLKLQNATQADEVMKEVSKAIQRYPFDFRGARILSGVAEGAYGWITINYLLEGFVKFSFQGKWLHPVGNNILGALDMGGASTQITFVPAGPVQDPQTAADFRLYGFNYRVYTHSYLCYGKEQAMKQLQVQLHTVNFSQNISHPCYHTGFRLNLTLGDLYNSPCVKKPTSFDPAANVTFYGSSDPEKCSQLVQRLFNFSGCTFSPSCSFNGIYQPPVNGNFFAFSAYFYTFNFLGLVPQASLSRVNSTIDSFCRRNWTSVKTAYPSEKDKYLQDYCGSAVYMKALLLDGFNFTQNWNSISFQKKAGDADIGWTLGYMLNLTNLIPSEPLAPVTGVEHGQWAAGIFFIVFVMILSILVLFILSVRNTAN
ncbi:ectonucleoside triphosphate diphosphohydrolase 8 [Paramormyrops kingsleyae]|uniref:Ectonucleoside triphosphate diphosphohydrolase 8 n=1 Tax=Paramormyrops kingsleyae TaxID=1676925 RepID=A0A3B3Q5V9_9TELE|nr:ectonucleoside triphosphate diphosphohydrolase 8-like [Paramormyrops kingsleyae]XP_023676400.1 ectonucleoside triphosphate diphosphohydrolase 8-like [Paramormyrops kingsleyae]XP_023676401.1 ectonucleoside triphosphate diphosphohydrolase 8-like [Paramormyrops kingsleyae]